MEKRESVIPYMLAVIGVIQVITLMVTLGIPTEKKELVCRGLFTSPNAITCYEQ